MGFDGEGCLAGWSDSVNIEVFNHFSEKHMLPKLKKGDFDVWDNDRFHGDTKL